MSLRLAARSDSVNELQPLTARPLAVKSLSLHCFRNYASARIETNAASIVLAGRNGAGKTNILEALSLLTPGRGLRRAKLLEIDYFQSDQPWAIAAHTSGMAGEVLIGTGRLPEAEEQSDKRLIKIDGKQARSQAELGKHLAMLWLTPQMEQLFQEGASAGRKFLDRLVYSFDPDHASHINAYDYAMRERNKLLAMGNADPAWLDSVEQTMAEMASAIASARLHAIEGINHTMQASRLSFPKAQLAVEGFVEGYLQAGISAVRAEEGLRGTLARERSQDAAAGRALTGTHRSNLRVFYVEKQLPAEACSTGEQKALLLSIVLSQARTTALKKGVVPVLLFDEIAAHLDAIRRLELFEEICQIGAQTWMTGTDEKLFAGLKGNTQYFRIEDGQITHD